MPYDTVQFNPALAQDVQVAFVPVQWDNATRQFVIVRRKLDAVGLNQPSGWMPYRFEHWSDKDVFVCQRPSLIVLAKKLFWATGGRGTGQPRQYHDRFVQGARSHMRVLAVPSGDIGYGPFRMVANGMATKTWNTDLTTIVSVSKRVVGKALPLYFWRVEMWGDMPVRLQSGSIYSPIRVSTPPVDNIKGWLDERYVGDDTVAAIEAAYSDVIADFLESTPEDEPAWDEEETASAGQPPSSPPPPPASAAPQPVDSAPWSGRDQKQPRQLMPPNWRSKADVISWTAVHPSFVQAYRLEDTPIEQRQELAAAFLDAALQEARAELGPNLVAKFADYYMQRLANLRTSDDALF